MCPPLSSPTLRPAGLEMELRLRTEVALCTLSLEDGRAWQEGLALLGLPGQDGADLSRAGGASSGAVEGALLGVAVHWQACCLRHPQTR